MCLKVFSSFIYGDTEFPLYSPETEGFHIESCTRVETLELGTVQIWGLKVCSSCIYGDTEFPLYCPKTEDFQIKAVLELQLLSWAQFKYGV